MQMAMAMIMSESRLNFRRSLLERASTHVLKVLPCTSCMTDGIMPVRFCNGVLAIF